METKGGSQESDHKNLAQGSGGMNFREGEFPRYRFCHFLKASINLYLQISTTTSQTGHCTQILSPAWLVENSEGNRPQEGGLQGSSLYFFIGRLSESGI